MLELVSGQDAAQFHNGIDSQSHRVQVEDIGRLLRIDLIETLFKHLGFLAVGLLPGVLASRDE